MQNTYFKTSFTSSRTDLIQTAEPDGKLIHHAPYGVWLFGGDSASLKSVTNDKMLTMSAGTDSVVYTENSAKISTFTNKYLSPSLTDVGSVTVVGIAKIDSTQIRILAGNLRGGATASAVSNWGIWTSGGAIYFSMYLQGGTKLSQQNLGATVALGDYFIFAVSVNKATNIVTAYCKNAGVESSTIPSYVGSYEGTGSEIVLGNANYVAQSGAGYTEYAEATFYDKALTLAEIKQAATFAEARALERGIVI